MDQKVLLIGLDCAPPELLFDRFLPALPNIGSLIDSGLYGDLRSTIPPITVPAWMSMATGKDPGTLGLYGLRNRADYSYNKMAIASSKLVREKTLWDILSAASKKIILVGVPQTYPPKPINGCMVTSFLTPSNKSPYTYPASLKPEIEQVSSGYLLDVQDFRTENKTKLLHQIYEMTEKRFKVTKHLMQTRKWDFLMHVEMGTDRIHHGFWRFLDKDHRKHDPKSEFRNAIRDYYCYLDREIGELIARAGKNTSILLVSDHGAKRIDGGICINEWLIQEKYLSLKTEPIRPTPLKEEEIDWENTIAWGAGGYYARIFLNITGREPKGAVSSKAYESVRDELANKLRALPDLEGNPLPTKVFKPQEVYKTCNGIPPDLIVYLGNLFWRSLSTVGQGSIHSLENDTGPDDANHAQNGVFVLKTGLSGNGKQLFGLDILDVAPTVLSLMGIPIPNDMSGCPIVPGSSTNRPNSKIEQSISTNVYSDEEKTILEERLKALGYL